MEAMFGDLINSMQNKKIKLKREVLNRSTIKHEQKEKTRRRIMFQQFFDKGEIKWK